MGFFISCWPWTTGLTATDHGALARSARAAGTISSCFERELRLAAAGLENSSNWPMPTARADPSSHRGAEFGGCVERASSLRPNDACGLDPGFAVDAPIVRSHLRLFR